MVTSKSQRQHEKKKTQQDEGGVRIELSPAKALLFFVLPVLASFGMGAIAREGIITRFVQEKIQGFPSADSVNGIDERVMPNPTLLSGKEFPNTRYTTKSFTSEQVKTSTNIHLGNTEKDSYSQNNNGSKSQSRKKIDNTQSMTCDDDEKDWDDDEKDWDDDEEEHLPAGQHLLVDIKNVEADFLNSDVRLAQAMIDVVNESKLTLLSYHCHSLLPMGVSCVGVLLESHISFHTWPTEGVITLDLFTCGSGQLMPVLPILERLFGIPRTPKDGESFVAPFSRWMHKLRGFRPEESKDYLSNDLGIEILANSEWKQEVSLMSRCIHCLSMR